MAHIVKFTVPERDLGKGDLEFKVRKNGKVLGTLKVSKGKLEWVPKDLTYGYNIGWDKLDELAKNYGKRNR